MDHRDKRPRLDSGAGSIFDEQIDSAVKAASDAMNMPENVAATTATAPSTSSAIATQNEPVTAASNVTALPGNSTWQGWAEIENDPIVFNVMLREWGVQGVQVNEVVPLETIYESSPTSTYGLVFLSRYKPDAREKEEVVIPDSLWFANQISTFSCATVALMNIISNSENINLGPELNQFVTATSDMSSLEKGCALDSFDHIRKVHNSFATLVDMKAVDRRLRHDALAHAKRQKQAAKTAATAATTTTTTTTKKAKKGKQPANKKKGKGKQDDNGDDDDDETLSSTTSYEQSGFHFTAYLPFHGHLWRMDGLDRAPESLGPLAADHSDWLGLAAEELTAQWINAAENDIEFSLLSLVGVSEKDGVGQRMEEMAAAVRMREDWGPALAEVVRIVAERDR